MVGFKGSETDLHLSADLAVESFLENGIANYSKMRNFDFGRGQHRAVSQLSPYISHGVISEFDLVKRILDRYSIEEVEKYIQEIFWRVYWKGWLEHRHSVYRDLAHHQAASNIGHARATSGQTGIECFDDWVDELKSDNYLHNHSRMWFASIWIFTLKLPWQLGAKFFQKHLYDGDSASNTLSWRWVAGLQTQGKNYLARSTNIQKFTQGRYGNISLNESAASLFERDRYEIETPLYPEKNNPNYKKLLVFDNQLSVNSEFIIEGDYEEILVVVLGNDDRLIQVDDKVINFKKKLAESFCNNLDRASLINSNSLRTKLVNNKEIDILYPNVGDNLYFIHDLIQGINLEPNLLVREMDRFCWNFAKKGFFNFKKNIPLIIDKLYSAN